MNDKFVFGVDLDGVCGDFYKIMREIAAEWKGVDKDKLPTTVTYGLKEWALDDMGGYDALHRFAVTQRNLFREMPIIAECRPVLRRLSTAGVHIRIVTHRLFIKYFHQKAAQQTIEWLDSHGIPYWDLCFIREKWHIGADIYIDDAPDNIQKIQSLNRDCIIFTNSTNTHLKGLRANTWLEVEEIVMDRYKNWQLKQNEESYLSIADNQ
jgi:5'(3')-deoxyribonucleotidase